MERHGRKHKKAKEANSTARAVLSPEEPEATAAAAAATVRGFEDDRDPDACPKSPALRPDDDLAHVTEALPSLTLSNGTNGTVDHDHESPRTSPTPTPTPAPAPAPEDSSACKLCDRDSCATPGDIRFESYRSELQMADIMKLIQKDLSEPYSIYTYRYFIHNWPKLCFLAMHNSRCIGAIVCKLDLHRAVKRGYIAMLAVDEKYRKRKIGSMLVTQAIQVMIADRADEVVLETEITNKPALKLYENLGFVRDKRLFRYYLNGVDALRLKLWLR